MATTRAYTSSRFFVELDGKPAGFVVEASGGEPVAAVAEAAPDASGVIRKELGAVSYEPIVLQVSTGAGKELYDWIAAVPARKQRPHDGALVLLDYNNSEQARLTWTDGLISEIVFPALDASLKDTAAMSVTIQPRSTRYMRSTGQTHPSFSSKQGQKRFQPANFRVSIGGLPTFSTRVSSVEPITVRQEIEAGERASTLGAVHVGNVEVTGGEAWAADLRSWLDDFVVDGHPSDKNERSLTVELLSPNLKDALLTLSLRQVGIYTVMEGREQRTGAAIALVRAGLYAEELTVAFDPSVVGVTQVPPPPAPPASTPTTAEALTTEGFLDAWRTGVRVPRPSVSPESVAARLRATAVLPAPVEVVNAREDDGRRFGETWAREIGSLDELEVVTELAGAEWTTATLPENHSLLRALGRAGAAADPDVTSLSDDPFIRGVVAGAASVRQELEGLLKPAD